MKTKTLTRLTALPVALLAPWQALAQDFVPPAPPPPAASDVPVPASDEEVTFSADALEYDDQAEIVTASGAVRMLRAGNRLRAGERTELAHHLRGLRGRIRIGVDDARCARGGVGHGRGARSCSGQSPSSFTKRTAPSVKPQAR